MLAMLDEFLIRRGHRSLVLAPARSRCCGLLIPAQIPAGVLYDNAKREAWSTFKQLLERTLMRHSVDVVHTYRQSNSAAPTDFALSGTELLANNCSVTGTGNSWPFVS